MQKNVENNPGSWKLSTEQTYIVLNNFKQYFIYIAG